MPAMLFSIPKNLGHSTLSQALRRNGESLHTVRHLCRDECYSLEGACQSTVHLPHPQEKMGIMSLREASCLAKGKNVFVYDEYTYS